MAHKQGADYIECDSEAEVYEFITGKGIDSWNQVESVIRELAELESLIKNESIRLEQRIELLKKYSKEASEPAISRQIVLTDMLKAFLESQTEEKGAILKIYRFGKLSFRRRKLSLELNAELAGNMTDKP